LDQEPFALNNLTGKTFNDKFSYNIFISKLKYFEVLFQPKILGLGPLFGPRGPDPNPHYILKSTN